MPRTEIEIKFLEINRDEMEAKLINLGAKKVFDGLLDHVGIGPKPDGVVGFRLRKEGDIAKLTVKSAEKETNEVKNVLEHEVVIDDFDEALALFQTLGFHIRTKRKKHRLSYELDAIKIEFDKLLDEHDFVPEFMELEAHSEADLISFLPRLGLRLEDSVPWSNRQVIAHYRQFEN